MAARNEIDREIIADPGEPRRNHRKKKKQPVPEHLKGTRMGKAVRKGERKPPAVPKNKSLGEVEEMDPDDPGFKHPDGRPRTTGNIPKDRTKHGDASPADVMRADKQHRANARRARARKGEAVVTKAVEVLHAKPTTATPKTHKGERVSDEERAVAEGIMSLDDWDDEELIRGYKRNRNGRFGAAPKFIPKEIQQEVFRRIVGRGDMKMRRAYLASIDTLVDLAEDGSSEKVRLEATKELMNRVVGKVPDRVHVAQEQPYEQFLADAIVPVGDEWVPDPTNPDDMDEQAALPPGSSPPPSGADFGGVKGAKEMPDA